MQNEVVLKVKIDAAEAIATLDEIIDRLDEIRREMDGRAVVEAIERYERTHGTSRWRA